MPNSHCRSVVAHQLLIYRQQSGNSFCGFQLFARLTDALGPVSLINAAGIAGASGQTTGNVDYKSWAHVLEVNTMGPLRVLESFIEHIARSERRLVVTITSGMGSLANNKSGGSIAYRSSKAAVNMVMRSAAIDLAPRGISCVLVNPGWVRTDMGGPKAPLSPQESVKAMRRLINTLGPKNSGQFYNYDGCEYP
jgi:NAD(P)-dependent dehydrogenase (short-subunit alcohol dehydrogenase family)